METLLLPIEPEKEKPFSKHLPDQQKGENLYRLRRSLNVAYNS
jgi:hypothetical protein